MSARLLFRKALHQLDRDRTNLAVTNLEQVLVRARQEQDYATFAGASCCLGDYLIQVQEYSRARPVLEGLLSLKLPGEQYEVELRRAVELLQSIPRSEE